MTNESKHDLAAAKETLASLEADSAKTAVNVEAYRLGQLLRESSATQLPAADPELRDQLLAEMERLPALNEVTKEKKPLQPKAAPTRRNRKWAAAFATAAAVTVAIGGTLWVTSFNFNQNHQSNLMQNSAEDFIRDDISWESAGIKIDKQALLDAEYFSRVVNSEELDSKLKPGQENYGWTEKSLGELAPSTVPAKPNQFHKTFVQPGQKIESISNDGRVDTGGGLGTIEAYPAEITNLNSLMVDYGIASTTENTVVSVPDGGTVLIGGVKRMSEGVPYPDPEEWKKKSTRRSRYGEIRLKNYDQLEGDGWRFKKNKPNESGEQYDPIVENDFIESVGQQALSTFSIDVDTASYSNMRRFINSGQLPPPDSVRIEELVNYFQYDYPQPEDGKPFRVAMEVAQCPWQPEHRLVRIGIKGQEVHRNERPASNLVFLLDVSGSMKDADKLPLLQRGLQMMLDRLNENDRVSIVTYASNAGVRLNPTSGDQKIKIRDVIDGLSADGSTNGSAGIEMAYDLAAKNFIQDGTNRVILATDGDLNVGVTDDESLVKMIKAKASEGVFLTVLGFGTGNLKDSKMEKLADNGNGMYAYIDSMREAHKVLVEQMSASLVTIAKDVKLQVEFNPAEVKSYRLLGYENRKMANTDFANDKKDAGEIGAGHTVTALYEIVPAGITEPQTLSTNLKYQPVEKGKQPQEATEPKQIENKIRELEIEQRRLSERLGPAHRNAKALAATIEDWKRHLKRKTATGPGELLTLAIRYKQPDASESEKIEFTLADSKTKFYEASGDFRFAAAVASFGMLLRNSQFSGNMDLEKVENIASKAIGEDPSGYRIEFVDLVRQLSNATDE